MDMLHIFHILPIPTFLHKSFTIESLSLYLFSFISHFIIKNSTPFLFTSTQALDVLKAKEQHPQVLSQP